MNKYLFILGIVGTALMSACSSDDLTMVPSQEEERALIVEASKDSDVPITLGVGSSRGFTRSPLVPGEGGVFSTEDNRYLGVFCLSTGIQSGVDASLLPSNIRLNRWNSDDTGLLVRMKNVPASVLSGDVTFMNSNATAVQTYYYPMGNWMKYNFYAYYPRQEETVEFVGQDRPTIEFSKDDNNYYYLLEKYYEIDGTQDIIWGKADPPEGDAFSARYFIENVSADKPQFSFEHKLVQFRFFVKAANPDVADNVKITNMSVPNALGYLALVIANQNPAPVDSMKEGTIKVFGKKNVKKKLNVKWLSNDDNYKDKDRFDGTIGNALAITTDAVDYNNPVGYLMLANPAIGKSRDGNFKYELQLDWAKKVGDDFVVQGIPISVELSDDFAEGKIYNIVVTVNPDLNPTP